MSVPKSLPRPGFCSHCCAGSWAPAAAIWRGEEGGVSQSTELNPVAPRFLSVGSWPPALHELRVISKQNNSYCCASGYEVNEWHVCSGLSQPYSRLPGAFLSFLLSPWVWFMQGRSRRAWASVWWWLFLSLEKRKETMIGVFAWCEVLTRPRPQSFWEVFSGQRLPQQLRAVPQRIQADLGQLSCQDMGVSLRSLGCLPKTLHCCSGTTKGWDFQNRWLCFEKQCPLQVSAAQDGAVSASCLLATVRAVVAKAAQPVSGRKGRDPRLILLNLADELSRSSWRETCLICETSCNA